MAKVVLYSVLHALEQSLRLPEATCALINASELLAYNTACRHAIRNAL